MVRRRSMARPCGSGPKRRVGRESSGSTSASMRRRARATSSAFIWAKSRVFSTSRSEEVRRAVTSCSTVSGSGSRRFGRKASRTRDSPGFGFSFWASAGAIGDSSERSFST